MITAIMTYICVYFYIILNRFNSILEFPVDLQLLEYDYFVKFSTIKFISFVNLTDSIYGLHFKHLFILSQDIDCCE